MSLDQLESAVDGNNNACISALPDGHGVCELTGTLCEIRQIAHIKLPWPKALQFRRGSDFYLRGLEVYYDFNWRELFSHNNSTFPKGSYLATHARRRCPAESHPAILLTTRSEVQEVGYISNAGRYIVVVNINDYLRHVDSNPAATFVVSPLVGRLGWLASLEDGDLDSLKASDPSAFAKLIKLARRCVSDQSTTPEDVQVALERLPELDQVSIDAIIRTMLNRGADTEVILQRLMAANQSDDLSDVLEWLLDERNVNAVKQLSRLEGDSLNKLSAVSNIIALRRLLTLWEANKDNVSEHFWQTTLSDNMAVLSQLFAFPIVVIQEQAYVGGKRVDNRGGSVTDFLCKNARTNNVAIIEIKTPSTPLLGSQYRGGIYNVAPDISGAVIQVASQCDKLLKNCFKIMSESDEAIYMFSPKCVVLAGNTEQIRHERDRVQSFELYRSGLSRVEVVTFDELFGRAALFIDALESPRRNDASPT